MGWRWQLFRLQVYIYSLKKYIFFFNMYPQALGFLDRKNENEIWLPSIWSLIRKRHDYFRKKVYILRQNYWWCGYDKGNRRRRTKAHGPLCDNLYSLPCDSAFLFWFFVIKKGGGIGSGRVGWVRRVFLVWNSVRWRIEMRQLEEYVNSGVLTSDLRILSLNIDRRDFLQRLVSKGGKGEDQEERKKKGILEFALPVRKAHTWNTNLYFFVWKW